MSAPYRDAQRDSSEVWEDDAGLVRRAAESAHGGRLPAPRWSHVGAAFSLGSTSATRLCRRLGLDPDEQVGYDNEGGE